MSSPRMLWALMRIEGRLYRPVIIAAIAIFMLGEIGVSLISIYTATHRGPGVYSEPLSVWLVGEMLVTGSALGWCANCILAATFGGTSLATERREGWVDLAAMQPVSRHYRLVAKFIVGVGLYSTFFALHAAAVGLGIFLVGIHPTFTVIRTTFNAYLAVLPLLSVALFGIAWMLSMVLRSPAIAAAVSLGVVTFAFIIDRMNSDRVTGNDILINRASIAAVLGVLMIATSWGYYLKRVAP